MIDPSIENFYTKASEGAWDALLPALEADPALAARCSRFVAAGSGWTFLHQSAHWGHEGAARLLIRLGAAVEAPSQAGETPAAVATGRGHPALARLLEAAGQSGRGLWRPPADPDLLPSSSAFGEAVASKAARLMRVAYGGWVVTIAPGGLHFVDSFGRTLVGWHGSYNPPCGMDGRPMV